MTQFTQVKDLKYPASIVANIILDVESYPEFLPWVKKIEIKDKKNEEFIASTVVNFKGFVESYESLVTYSLDDKEYFINTKAISGPFKKLVNKWHIVAKEDGCRVNFFVDFEFKSIILNTVIGMVFSVATQKIMDAFEARAEELSKA